MAYLATLEGEETNTITLDDLFNVNDYLGVRYFGVPAWNRIKAFACQITENAKDHPTAFLFASIGKPKNDNTKPSELSYKLFGFNDLMGGVCMGEAVWDAVKREIDGELLGFSISSIGKGIANAAKGVAKATTTVAKAAVNAPAKVAELAVTKTPLKYTPTAQLYKYIDDKTTSKVRDATKSAAQKTLDVSSEMYYKLATKTPLLKYTPTAKLIAQTEKVKEEAGITSKGTADVYETDAEYAAKKQAAAKAAAQAASAASKQRTAELKAASQKQDLATQAVVAQQAQQAAEQEQAATQQALDVMEDRVTSKYAPIVMIGVFGLLALAIFKK